MNCICGDLYCPSCGPAQGNIRCFNCGKWSMDGGCDDTLKCENELVKRDWELIVAEAKEVVQVAEKHNETPPNWAVDIIRQSRRDYNAK